MMNVASEPTVRTIIPTKPMAPVVARPLQDKTPEGRESGEGSSDGQKAPVSEPSGVVPPAAAQTAPGVHQSLLDLSDRTGGSAAFPPSGSFSGRKDIERHTLSMPRIRTSRSRNGQSVNRTRAVHETSRAVHETGAVVVCSCGRAFVLIEANEYARFVRKTFGGRTP